MQAEQRERLVALAARVASETDPAKFHALLLELGQLLEESKQSCRDIEENTPSPPDGE